MASRTLTGLVGTLAIAGLSSCIEPGSEGVTGCDVDEDCPADMICDLGQCRFGSRSDAARSDRIIDASAPDRAIAEDGDARPAVDLASVDRTAADRSSMDRTSADTAAPDRASSDRVSSDRAATDTGGCSGGEFYCPFDGECHDLQTDFASCGLCGNSCVANFGDSVDRCVAGVCVCAATGAACSSSEACVVAGCSGDPLSAVVPATLTLPSAGCASPGAEVDILLTGVGSSSPDTVHLVEIGGRAISPTPQAGIWSSTTFSFNFPLCWDSTRSCLESGACAIDPVDHGIDYVYRVTDADNGAFEALATLTLVPGPLGLRVTPTSWSLPQEDQAASLEFTVTGAPADQSAGVREVGVPWGSVDISLDDECTGDCRWEENSYRWPHTRTPCTAMGRYEYEVVDLYGRRSPRATIDVSEGTPILKVNGQAHLNVTVPLTDVDPFVYTFYLGGTNQYRAGLPYPDLYVTVSLDVPVAFPGTALDAADGWSHDTLACGEYVLVWHQPHYMHSGGYVYTVWDAAGEEMASAGLTVSPNPGARLRIAYTGAVGSQALGTSVPITRPVSGCDETLVYTFRYEGNRVDQDYCVRALGFDPDAEPGLDLCEHVSRDQAGTFGTDDGINTLTYPARICDTTPPGTYYYAARGVEDGATRKLATLVVH